MVDRFQDEDVKIVYKNKSASNSYQTHEKKKVTYSRKGTVAIVLTIIFVVLFVIIAAPPITFYALFYDGNTNEHQTTEIENPETFLTNKVYRAIDNTESGQINLEITEADLNGLIAYATNGQIPPEIQKYVKDIYCVIDEENYDFYLECEIPYIFKTRVNLSLNLIGTEKNQEIDEPVAFSFEIENLKIGRLGGLANLGVSLVEQFIGSENIEAQIADTFASIGLNMTIDWENLRIYYTQANLYNDIVSIIQANVDLPIVTTLFQEFLSSDKLTVTNNPDSVEFGVNLEHLITDDIYLNKDEELDIDSANYRDAVEYMLNAGLIDETQIVEAFNYLYAGYDESASINETLQLINSQQWAEISALLNLATPISDFTNYVGLNFTKEALSDDFMVERINETDPKLFVNNDTPFEISYLTADEINDILYNTGFIGYTMHHTYLDENGDYQIIYFTIDDLYATINEENVSLVIGIDINGLKTHFVIKTGNDIEHLEGYIYRTSLEEVRLGEVVLESDILSDLFDLFNNQLTETDVVILDLDNMLITFDLTTIFNEALYNIPIDDSHLNISLQIGNKEGLNEPVILVMCVTDYRVDITVNVDENGNLYLEETEIPPEIEEVLKDYIENNTNYNSTEELIEDAINDYKDQIEASGGNVDELIDEINNNPNWVWDNLENLFPLNNEI